MSYNYPINARSVYVLGTVLDPRDWKAEEYTSSPISE